VSLALGQGEGGRQGGGPGPPHPGVQGGARISRALARVTAIWGRISENFPDSVRTSETIADHDEANSAPGTARSQPGAWRRNDDRVGQGPDRSGPRNGYAAAVVRAIQARRGATCDHAPGAALAWDWRGAHRRLGLGSTGSEDPSARRPHVPRAAGAPRRAAGPVPDLSHRLPR